MTELIGQISTFLGLVRENRPGFPIGVCINEIGERLLHSNDERERREAIEALTDILTERGDSFAAQAYCYAKEASNKTESSLAALTAFENDPSKKDAFDLARLLIEKKYVYS